MYTIYIIMYMFFNNHVEELDLCGDLLYVACLPQMPKVAWWCLLPLQCTLGRLYFIYRFCQISSTCWRISFSTSLESSSSSTCARRDPPTGLVCLSAGSNIAEEGSCSATAWLLCPSLSFCTTRDNSLAMRICSFVPLLLES